MVWCKECACLLRDRQKGCVKKGASSVMELKSDESFWNFEKCYLSVGNRSNVDLKR